MKPYYETDLGGLYHGNCLTVLQEFKDNSVDAVIVDPPYGYNFMQASWDAGVPKVEIWREALRVLKAGAFAFIMSAPRQDVQAQMICNLRDAGFVMAFSPIYWAYAMGFPKANNIGKAIDKRAGVEREVVGYSNRNIAKIPKATGYHGTQTFAETAEAREKSRFLTAPATPEAKRFDGAYGGFQPKPAVEVILVAMKPLDEKTFVDQALKNGKGVTWMGDCRIPTREQGQSQVPDRIKTNYYPKELGRFPANLLVSDDALNDGIDYRGCNIISVNRDWSFGCEKKK